MARSAARRRSEVVSGSACLSSPLAQHEPVEDGRGRPFAGQSTFFPKVFSDGCAVKPAHGKGSAMPHACLTSFCPLRKYILLRSRVVPIDVLYSYYPCSLLGSLS